MSGELGPCPSADDLERLLAEQLSGPERETIETHVEQCTTCQERLEWLSGEAEHPVTARVSAAVMELEPRADFLRRLRETPPQPTKGGPPITGRLGEVPLGSEFERIGQYEVLEKLAKGGMGAVYKARHVELGKVVALKLLTADHMDEVRISRFKNEVRAIGRLDHPHIVAAHDAGEVNGIHYLVMDFVDGEDLGRVVERHQRLSVPNACEAVRQAAIGLQHAFERGFVHRDIKPSNLMLTRAGRVQLLDLGLARSFQDRPAETLTTEGMVLGTADYLAPEQWEHAHSADIRADIYSLGCTLYHFLAGKPPFGGRQYGSLLQKLRGHVYTPHAPITSICPEVPVDLAGIIDRMMAKLPSDRFATPAEVAGALEPFAVGAALTRLVGSGKSTTSVAVAADTVEAPITVAKSESRPGTRKTARRSAVPLALAVLGAVAAIAAFIYWPKRDQPSAPVTPLAIEDLRVNHYRGRQAKDLGNIRTSEEIRKNDDVRVFARLNQPAYCYLIAFNPDGTEQLCHPAFDGSDQGKARALAPTPVTEVRFFPDDKGYFNLDSAGLQVFVLVASAQPLPPYADWRAAVDKIPWRSVRHGGDSRWQFDGREFARLSEVRGKREERDAVPAPLRELCEFFQVQSGVEAVRVVAFPVVDVDPAARLKALELDLCRAGQYEEAKETVRDLISLSIREKGKDHWETLDHQRELQALEIIAALPEPDRKKYTRALMQLDESIVLQKRGRFPEAVPPAKEAIDVLRQYLGRDHLVSAQAAVHCGNLLRQSAKPAEAEAVLREALESIRKAVADNHTSTAAACIALALVLEEQARGAEALPLLDSALEISRRLRGEDHADVAVVLNNLAGYYQRQALFDKAVPHYRKALDILIRAEGEEGQSTAVTKHNLAYSLTNQGKLAEGETLYRDVLRLRRQILPEGHPDIGMTCNNLAFNLDLQGRHSDAEPFYREVFELYRRRFGDDSPFTAMAGNGLGLNLQNQAKYEDAEPFFENALRVYASTGYAKRQAAAVAHNNLAANLRAQRRFDAAREHSEKSLAILRDILGETHPEVAQLYNNVAAILDDQKKFAEAGSLIRKALHTFETRLGKDHPQTALVFANLAVNLHNQEKYVEAEPGLREALETHRRLLGEGHPGTAWMYKNLVTNCWVRGDYRGAVELGAAASDSFESARRRISFTGMDRVRRTDDLSPLRHLAASAARNGQPKDAWRYLESGWARGLLDDLSVRPLTDAERAREKELVRDLDRLNDQIAMLPVGKSASEETRKESDSLRRERDNLQSRFVELQIELARKYGVAAGRVHDLASIQNALAADAALIAWLDIAGDPTFKDPNGEHWACVVRHQGDPVWVQLPGAASDRSWQDGDEALTALVRGQFSSRAASKTDWRDAAGRLYRQRFDPIEKSLAARDGMPAVRRLIVLPSSQMAGIPAEALTDRFIVSYAPSATMFAWLQEQRHGAANDPMRRRSLLALGDPDFRVSSMARLPATRTEVHTIARLFNRSQLLLGPDASQQNLDQLAASGELRKFRFLHFATHGLLDESRPLASALLLAQDQSPNPSPHSGRLTAERILRTWKLDAELVTLSACETGLGKYSKGEGYLGFSQALFLAGARSMVLSLWPVDDRATTLVMTRFYENMLGTPEGNAKQLPKAEALAEARRWVSSLTAAEVDRLAADLPRGLPNGTRGIRREADAQREDAPRPFAHPSYWSAFILIGDPR